MYTVFEQLLLKFGVTAYKVSKDTGITQTLLSNWKTGKSVPNMHNLKKIADYFNVTVDYLMTGDTEKASIENTLDGVYLSLAREAQENGISPNDIRAAIDLVKRIKGE